jgi:hypothetical protein
MMAVENIQREAKVSSLNDLRTDSKRAAGEARLADLSDASHFHNRGFSLPLCKSSGLVTIRVDATKSLAVLVKHSHLPVMVFSPLVFPE